MLKMLTISQEVTRKRDLFTVGNIKCSDVWEHVTKPEVSCDEKVSVAKVKTF